MNTVRIGWLKLKIAAYNKTIADLINKKVKLQEELKQLEYEQLTNADRQTTRDTE